MNVLKFNISGLGASFSRPHFNSVISSYSHIHKVSILGILGAVIGIDKLNNTKGLLPQFYEELKDIKVSIVPHEVKFFKKTEHIIEHTGFNNAGSNLVVRIENIINPSWDIYLVDSNNNKHFEKIKDYLLNNKSVYMPYLGRNHWFAEISDVKEIEGSFINVDEDEIDCIDSLVDINEVELEENDDFTVERIYFKEFMPVGINEVLMQYEEKQLVITNDIVVSANCKLLECDDKVLYLI